VGGELREYFILTARIDRDLQSSHSDNKRCSASRYSFAKNAELENSIHASLQLKVERKTSEKVEAHSTGL
jgi:hypothetical protein